MPLTVSENGDILSTVDFRVASISENWTRESEASKPWRPEFRAAFAELLAQSSPKPRRILELGSGPGLLAKRILEENRVDEYVLFDFAEPMMKQAQENLRRVENVSYVLGDFKSPTWPTQLSGKFDAIVSMQAVHEIRHKRHVPWLYAQARTLLHSGGSLLVCDAEPFAEQVPEQHQLGSSRREQEYAMLWAGFDEVVCHKFEHRYYLFSAKNP